MGIFYRNPNLTNLLLDDYFREVIERCQASWRRVIAKAWKPAYPPPPSPPRRRFTGEPRSGPRGFPFGKYGRAIAQLLRTGGQVDPAPARSKTGSQRRHGIRAPRCEVQHADSG